MAETPKTPKNLTIKKLRAKASEGDDYEQYMQSVLRQAHKYPDKPCVRTHG